MIYYISKKMLAYKEKYPPLGKTCVALVRATRKCMGILHVKLKKYATRFKMVDRKLFKRSFQGKWLVCIPNKEVKGILLNYHKGELVGHPGGRKLR